MLAGIGNLTLSQLTDTAGGTITISGGTAGAGFSLGASGGNTAGQTGATGTRVVLAGGNGITLSQATDANGGSITISGQTHSQSVQTQDRFDLTLDGNTAGALQLVSSGTLSLAGGNNVTLSQNGNAITVSGADTHAEQTGISSIVASNATYTSGSVQFSGSGIVTVQSSANQRVIINASQSVQTQNLHNVTLSGNTAGAMAQISSGTMTLAGGANITLSQAGNAVSIIGGAGGGATAISGIAASNTTYTSGTVTITGVGGGVTVSSNTGQRIDISVAAPVAQTNQAGSVYAVGNTTSSSSGTYDARTLSLRGDGIISIAATNSGFRISASQSLQTSNVHNLTLSGNTAGAMAQVSSGTVTLAGGNNITLSQAGNAITISGANIGGAQTGISGIANSQTTYTSGTVSLSELGAITIRSTTGNQFQLSVNAQSVQPETQTFLGALAASNTTYTSGTVTITGVGGGITVSSNTGQRIDLSVAAQTNQAGSLYAIGNTTSSSSGTYDARTLSISGAGIISIAATNSGFKISATQSNQAGSLYAIGNTTSSSSGTYDARTLSLSGAGIISIAATNSGFKISASESVQTQNLHNVTLSGNTSGVMAQISSGTMTLAGGNNITLSQAGNAVTISGANVGGAQTGISSIAASNTTYTSGQVEFTGSGIVTVQSSANQRVVIHASQSVQTQSLFSAGISNLGNTVGDSGVTGTRMVLAGINGITLSQATNANGNTISVSGVTQTVQTQNMVAVTLSGNTSGAQALISSGTMTIAGGNNITVSQAGNAVTISGPNVGGAQTGISGIANSQTTYTSGTVSLSELGAITIRSTTGNQFQLSVNAQSVQPETQTFVGGLANSQTTYTSGTISLSELGAITIRSTTGNQFQLSVNAQSVQPETQTFVAGIAGSNTTYTSGTISITGVGGGVTVSSNTGQRIDISVATPVAQTNQAGSLYAVGNTTSSSSGTYDARTLSLRGDGIISIAATNSGFRISASQSLQTSNVHNVSLSGNTAGAMAQISSGTMTLAGGNGITLSQAGNAVTISGVTQSTQPGIQHLVVSNTTFSSGTVSLSGFGDITVNTAANLIRISGPVQTAQTGISGIANSQTTYTSGTVSLSELGAITIRSTTGNQFQLSVNSQTVQTQNLHNVTLSGNTAGAMAHISSGTMTLAGGNGITLSQAGNAVTISGGAGGAAFSAGVSTGGNTAGNTGVSGTQMVLAGMGAMSLSQTTGANGNTVSILAPASSLLSAVAPLSTSTAGSTISILGPAQLSVGFSTPGNTAGNTGFVTGRLALVGSNGITLSGSTNAGSQTITISGITQSLQTSNVHNVTLSGNTAGAMAQISSGTMTLAGGNGITLSQAGNAVTISGGAGGGFSAGVSNVGNTQGNTGVTGTRLVLAGTDNITLSQSTDANGATVRISGQSPAGGAFSGGASNLGNTAGATGISGTQMVLVGSGVLSLSQTTGANGNTVSLLAPAQSALSGVSPISLSTNGSTISVLGPAVSVISAVAPLSTTSAGSTISILGPAQLSAGFSTAGNTAGNTGFATGRLALVGGNGVTLSGSTDGGSQTITISGGGGGAGFTGGISGGNVAGDTGTVTGRIVFAGGNGITLSGSTNAGSQTITISGGAAGGFSAGVSNLGNTAGATGMSGSQMVLAGMGGLSLSQTTGANGNTISVLGPATSSLVGLSGISVSTAGSTISIMQQTGSAFLTSLAPYDESPMVTGQQGQGTLHLAPVRIPEGIQFDRVGLAVQISNTSNSSGSITLSQWFGLYTKNASSLSLYGSTSITTNFTGSGTVGSYSLYAGPAWQTIPWTTTIPEGDYYAGIIMRTTTGGAAGHSISQLLLSKFTNTAWSGIIGVASATSVQRLLGQGHYSATTSALPASIHFTQIIGSGSIALRSPVWHLRSGTV